MRETLVVGSTGISATLWVWAFVPSPEAETLRMFIPLAALLFVTLLSLTDVTEVRRAYGQIEQAHEDIAETWKMLDRLIAKYTVCSHCGARLLEGDDGPGRMV